MRVHNSIQQLNSKLRLINIQLISNKELEITCKSIIKYHHNKIIKRIFRVVRFKTRLKFEKI